MDKNKSNVRKTTLFLFGALVGTFGLNLVSSHSSSAESPRYSKAEDMKIFANYVSGFEGRRNRVYDPRPHDGRPEPTIGIGHYMNRGDSKETFARVLPGVDYDSIYNGTATLTDAQINSLFAEDLEVYVERARRLVPNFDKFSVSMQTALVDMAYRGDLGDSPRTLALLNKGLIREAADEYIRRNEYTHAGTNGLNGIKRRMDSNRMRLVEFSKNLEKALSGK